MSTIRIPATALLVCGIAITSLIGCAVKRDLGPGRPLGQCNYAVVSQPAAGEYYQRASAILDGPFVVVDEGDARLELPHVRQKACTVSVGWAPGFWSTSGWAEVKEYSSGTHMQTSHMRRGMLWTGANEDVIEALNDLAKGRAAAGALPANARDPSPAAPPDPRDTRSTVERLQELDAIRARGAISEREYDSQRQRILKEH